jgi:hydroxyacyl-ACP dehydratase HTD2-like protein with hotdog domain
MRAGVQLTKVPTTVAMFRMSAVMWNAHRVHYDQAYATGVEGHPGLLVPANLLSSYLCEAVMAWGGPDSRVLRMTFRTRAPVLADAVLTVWARPRPGTSGDLVVDLVLGIDDAAGGSPVTGTARVRIPADAEDP